jgi:two-component system sensor histidine kinase PilS (NtrC family)
VIESGSATVDRRKWLLRLIQVRIVAFTIFTSLPLLSGQLSNRDDLIVLLAAVYALSACWYGLLRLNQSYTVQAYAQVISDLLLITWTVNRTGGIDSYCSSLYFVEIVMASILLERRGAYVAATVSSILHFVHLDLVKYGAISSTGPEGPDWPALQVIIGFSIMAFHSVAYLTNYLAENWHHAGVQLERSTGRVAFLKAFNDRILDSMDSGLIVTDQAGKILLFNRAAEGISGCRAERAANMVIQELFPELSTIGVGRFDTWTSRGSEQELFLRFSVSELRIDDKQARGLVWCIDDLTGLRMLERQVRQKEQMAAIGAMSAGIAHEIRNPLASIAGSFNTLRSDLELTAEQTRLAQIITRETERLNRTIADFLSYARIPAPKPETMDLSVLISETVSLIRNSPELKPSHSIETRLQPVARPVDGGMMRQVFYNLATNAFKAMPDGGRLMISLEGRSSGAHIRFEDTGVGISEDQLERLFVPFQSSKNGTGLGLPIVYQIVTAHSGSISVKSRRGAGATFYIDI